MASLVPKVSVSLDGANWAAARFGGCLLAQGRVRCARSLVETGLIDEYRLAVHSGERIFRTPFTITPTSTTVVSGGAGAHVFAANP
jgi:hypothetical protein